MASRVISTRHTKEARHHYKRTTEKSNRNSKESYEHLSEFWGSPKLLYMNARTPTHNTISRESLQESATIAENHRWSCPNTKRGTQKTFSWKCHNFNPAYPCLPLQRNIIGPLVNKKTFLSPPNPTPLPLPSSSYLRLPPPGLSRVLLPLALRREGERGREEEGWKNDHHDLLSFSEGGIWFSPVLFLFLLFFFNFFLSFYIYLTSRL